MGGRHLWALQGTGRVYQSNNAQTRSGDAGAAIMQAVKGQPGLGLDTELLAGGRSGVHTQDRQDAKWLGEGL